MLEPFEGATVEKFDEAAMKELETLKGVRVFDSLRPDGDNDGKDYVVYMPGDVTPGAMRKYGSIVGVTQAAVIHQFGVLVSSVSPKARNHLLAAVRRRLLGFQIPGTSEAFETGALNSYGNTDSTVRPVRYTSYVTFQVTVDRSV